MRRVIYVMDPHCGWCYGNGTHITDLYAEFNDKIPFELIVGGMWLKPAAPKGGASFAEFINTHSPQMEKTTGAFVGKAFYNLTLDTDYVFSSLEPSAAIVLVKEIMADKAFSFAKEVQRAIFEKGKKLDELDTYIPILEELNLDVEMFERQWMSTENISNTQKEFQLAGQLTKGFPALLLQEDTTMHQLSSGYFSAPIKEQLVKFLTQYTHN